MSTVRYGADVQAAHAASEVRPVPTDRRRRRGEGTRARIMSAAAELFAARGFDATSTQTIAAASGITVAAIYRHVPSKADLLVAVARHALETTFTETMTDDGSSTAAQRIADIVVAYTEPQREFTRRLVVELTHAAAQHPEVATSLQTFHQRARRHIADVLEAGQRDGSLRSDVDATRAARDVLLLIMGICHIDALDPDALVDPEWHRSLRRTVHATIGSTSEPKPVEQ
jgi:AcrR family transcriptional regulator